MEITRDPNASREKVERMLASLGGDDYQQVRHALEFAIATFQKLGLRMEDFLGMYMDTWSDLIRSGSAQRAKQAEKDEEESPIWTP